MTMKDHEKLAHICRGALEMLGKYNDDEAARFTEVMRQTIWDNQGGDNSGPVTGGTPEGEGHNMAVALLSLE